MLGKLTKRELSVFLVLFFVGLVCSIDKSLIGVATPIIREQFGYSASEFANVTNMYYASNIIMTFVSGYIMDRFGFKPFMATCLALLGISSATFGLAGFMGSAAGSATGVLMGLLFSRFVVGIGQTGYSNGLAKAIVESFKPEVCQGVQAIVLTTTGIGSILVYTVFTMLVNESWQLAYFVLAAFFIVAFVLMVAVVPHKRTPPEEKVSLLSAWKHKTVIVLGVSLLCNNMASMVMMIWLPSYLDTIPVIQAEMVANPQLITMILIGYAVVMGVAMAVSDPITRRYFRGRERVLATVSGLGAAASMWLMTSSSNLAVIVVFLYVSTFLASLMFTLILNLPFAERADGSGTLVAPSMMSSANAVMNVLCFAGTMFGNTVVAGIADAAGFSMGFAALVVPLVISGVVLFLLPKTK